jgi:hypothetical protein
LQCADVLHGRKSLLPITRKYLRGSVDAMENLKMLENIFFKTDSDVMPE